MGFLKFLAFLFGRRKVAPGPSDEVIAEPPEALEASPVQVDPAPATKGGSFIDDLITDLDDAIGGTFDASCVVEGVGEEGDASDTSGQGYDVPRELFASISANYSRPIKNFIFEVQRGNATKDWLEICQPVMGCIIDGAESMELTAEAKRMTEFSEALTLALASEGRELDADSRELILSCYEELVEVLPDAFVLGEEDQRRESILIHSLLRQIPEVGRVTLEKLYGAGLTSLDALFLANVKDLTITSGVSEWLCEQICDKVQNHRGRLQTSTFELAQFDHRPRLVELLKELDRRHETFERIADQESPERAAEKRECRRSRQACALQINVVLAEMDELDLVEEIKRLSFKKRIERLEDYLDETADPTAGLLPAEPDMMNNSPEAR